MDSRSLADAVVQVAQEVKLMRGQLEGFVRHEVQSEKLNEHRREMISLLDAVERRLLAALETERRQTKAERSQEISQSESRMQRDMESRVAGVEKRAAEREARDERLESAMQRQMIWLAGLALCGFAFAFYQIFFRGQG